MRVGLIGLVRINCKKGKREKDKKGKREKGKKRKRENSFFL